MQTILVDPYPREMKLIFTPRKLQLLKKNYQLDKPKGVRGRSSNNDLVKKVLNWSYKMSLKEGLTKTYQWIESEMSQKGANLDQKGPKSGGADFFWTVNFKFQKKTIRPVSRTTRTPSEGPPR